jgi:ligand-binding sensor domain-containing protein
MRAVVRDRAGLIWGGIPFDGIVRFDGRGFLPPFNTTTVTNGLLDNAILCIHLDPDGVMLFGTREGGVARYDGRQFEAFPVQGPASR